MLPRIGEISVFYFQKERMRIISHKEFLKLPAGTVYMKYEPIIFGELLIKDDTLKRDWIYKDITCQVEYSGSHNLVDIMFEASKNRVSIDLDCDSGTRDGLFDPDQLFAVYEKKDIDRLRGALDEAIGYQS